MWHYGTVQAHLIIVAKAELQWKAAISDTRTRAAETLKCRRDEQGADYYSQRSVRDLPRIENLWFYIASYIQYYIAHAKFNAI